jgi:hypothetical protein
MLSLEKLSHWLELVTCMFDNLIVPWGEKIRQNIQSSFQDIVIYLILDRNFKNTFNMSDRHNE